MAASSGDGTEARLERLQFAVGRAATGLELPGQRRSGTETRDLSAGVKRVLRWSAFRSRASSLGLSAA